MLKNVIARRNCAAEDCQPIPNIWNRAGRRAQRLPSNLRWLMCAALGIETPEHDDRVLLRYREPNGRDCRVTGSRNTAVLAVRVVVFSVTRPRFDHVVHRSRIFLTLIGRHCRKYIRDLACESPPCSYSAFEDAEENLINAFQAVWRVFGLGHRAVEPCAEFYTTILGPRYADVG